MDWLIKRFRTAAEGFLNLLYPPHCTICLTETAAGEHLCEACLRELPRIEAPCCQVCSEPFSGQIDGEFTCPNCAERKFHFKCAVASYRSTKVVRELIHRFKYNRKFYLRHILAEWLADNLADPRLQSPSIDRIVPVPLHAARRRERGFNQAGVLAELLSNKSGIPLSDCVRRIRYTTTQTRYDRQTRMQNLRDAFSLRKSADVQGLHLLLIDDVFTTGSTVDECAAVLMAAGAASVRVATVARG
ncbi:MAG: ComF family protein [Verrucomicrobiota bacterium]